MTRYIDLVAAKKQNAESKYNEGKPVVGVIAIAPIKGKEKKGTVVYRRKVKYGDPFKSKK